MSGPADAAASPPAAGGTPRSLTAGQRRQVGLITAGAIGVFLGLRFLPTGTNLSHMDFRVDAKNSIEFCDPLNPQFIPVVAVRSPVTLSVRTDGPPTAGRACAVVAILRTASGKAIEPSDLVVAHTRKLHLLIVDPTLGDYQHMHPEPAGAAGEWSFSFTPRASGNYRIFADFTPAATGRGLYSSVDLPVAGPGADLGRAGGTGSSLRVGNALAEPGESLRAVELEGFRFALTPAVKPLRANQPIDLRLEVSRPDGGAVPLAPIMGAFAHLVAFDDARSGFAHLHPMEIDLARPPDAQRPVLNFKVTIPRAGRYVIWAQVNLGGRELFAPFGFRVE